MKITITDNAIIIKKTSINKTIKTLKTFVWLIICCFIITHTDLQIGSPTSNIFLLGVTSLSIIFFTFKAFEIGKVIFNWNKRKQFICLCLISSITFCSLKLNAQIAGITEINQWTAPMLFTTVIRHIILFLFSVYLFDFKNKKKLVLTSEEARAGRTETAKIE